MGEASSPKLCIEGVGADFEKPKKYFRLTMNRVV